MTDFEAVDYYTETGPAFLTDPHSYFAFLRGRGPITPLPYRNALAVTGYEEAIRIGLDPEHFSNFNSVTGAMVELPFDPQGDDIAHELEAARKVVPFADQELTADDKRHADLRSIMAVLFKPSRMKALEATLRGTADALIDDFIARGEVDLVRQFGMPYATLVITDLLGLPVDIRKRCRAYIEHSADQANAASTEEKMLESFVAIGKEIFRLLATRRLAYSRPASLIKRALGRPTDPDDILAELALARFPDGGRPSLADLAGLGTLLFGAGQDTTNRLINNAFKLLATRPDIQEELRARPERIPDFIEEMLRYDGPVKAAGRLCRRTATVGSTEIKAGQPLMLSYMAANRDPRRFDDPDAFDMNRPRNKEHLAFGRGPHTCIGAQLARAETRVSIERLLARLDNIRLSEKHHGHAGGHRFDYEPTYVIRALKSLHLEFDPR